MVNLTLFASDPTARALCDTESGAKCDTGLPVVAANSQSLNTILAMVFAILGVLCVLLIVIGALRLIEAQGDPQAVKKGRNTIVYAALGLIVAVSAEVIVAFVLGGA